MIRNYFTIALRQLRKHRFYTIINVFGLMIGITACLIIFLYVRFELSYDRFHENADRIVRVGWEVFFGETLTRNAAVTPPMAEVMAAISSSACARVIIFIGLAVEKWGIASSARLAVLYFATKR